MTILSDPPADIHSPENIARSRARAEAIRARVAEGKLDACWVETADAIDADATERETEAWLREHPSAASAMPPWATEIEVDISPEWVREGASALLIYQHQYPNGADIGLSADYLPDDTVFFHDPGYVVVTLPDDDTPLEDAFATVRDIRERTSHVREIEVSAGIYLHEACDLTDKILALVHDEGFSGYEWTDLMVSTTPLVSRRRQLLVDQLRGAAMAEQGSE